MKRVLFRGAVALGIVLLSSVAAKAQRFGDNLGNHKATKDLDVSGHQILNASGVAIGTATIDSASVALQIDGANKAVLITRADTAAIATPVPGMIVYQSSDNKFYVRNNQAWVSYSLAIVAADSVNTAANQRGYTLEQVGQNTVLKLSPADATNPGIVSIVSQEFAGDKTFLGKVAIRDSVTVGLNTAPASLFVTGVTTLNADTTQNGGLKLIDISGAAGSDEERVLVVNSNGTVKKSTFSANMLAKKAFPITAAFLNGAAFDAAGNSGIEVVITIDPVADEFKVEANDGIVVNFASGDWAALKGLAILSATATADNQVSVYIADMRNPADTSVFPTGYVAPDLVGKSLVVTRYNQ